MLGDLALLAAPADLPVAIERPDGIIVERLLAAGHPVVPVHPNAFHAARLRWGADRAKSDPADSYMLADYLRTARLGEARLAMFCRRHSYRGGRPPAELLQRLRDAAVAPVGLDPNVLTELVRAQTILIESALTTIARLDAAIGALLPSHPKTELLAPLPRIGEINLAPVIAEIGPLLDRCDNPDQAAAGCGVAPVTRQSGKSRNVQFRFSSNARARVALTCLADNSRHSSPRARHLYTTARQRGIRHPHAIRILARAWLRVIWACWHTDTAYDPARHTAEARHAA